MKYDGEFVKRIVDSPASGREIERSLHICRKTVYRWRNRLLGVCLLGSKEQLVEYGTRQEGSYCAG